jgi:hypothetical protein
MAARPATRPTLREASWEEVQEAHAQVEALLAGAPHVEGAAQRFAELLASRFSTIALARLFVVLPLEQLPAEEQAIATRFAEAAGRPVPLELKTPTLTLLGTAGEEPAWNRRESSKDHRAIPLIDQSLVDGAPMIAALLGSLGVKLANLRGDPAVQLRNLAGGLNARFYVPDAHSITDVRGRHVIAARDFVAKYGIKTVFGMGGVYVNGVLAVAIVFTREALEPVHIDRFPMFISSFKMATSQLVRAGRIFGV